MRYDVRPILLCVTALLASGCASSIQVLAPRDGCSTLIASRWAEPVQSAVLEDSGDAALDWQLFGVAQTGQLNIANRDKADALETIRRCEARDAAAVRQIEGPWWRKLWPG
nr:hypothetical protein [uncultured Brevundimonas sp.]